MSVALQIRDETTTGETTLAFSLDFLEPRITVRDLIETRVQQEVDNYNQRHPTLFKGLVQPTSAEVALNGFKIPRTKRIDVEEQIQKALAAFGTSALIVIINDRQAESLDEAFVITPESVVVFLKLVPLVGG